MLMAALLSAVPICLHGVSEQQVIADAEAAAKYGSDSPKID